MPNKACTDPRNSTEDRRWGLCGTLRSQTVFLELSSKTGCALRTDKPGPLGAWTLSEARSLSPMIDEADPRIPNTSTVWQLWHSDTFDRDSSPSLQGNGANIVHGLYKLWLYTLREGILENGSASFSSFHLTWGNTATARVDVPVNPFHNPALLKLRRWVGFISQAQESEDRKDATLLKLAQLHYDLLQKSSRWKASTIDWGAEARELLARVELIADPEEL